MVTLAWIAGGCVAYTLAAVPLGILIGRRLRGQTKP